MRQLKLLHELPTEACPFERRLASMFDRAADVVRRDAVNPDFLTPDDQNTPPVDLLDALRAELPRHLIDEPSGLVVCHDRSLSFICADNGETIASVRMTPISAGSVKGHLLGPLAVRPSHKNRGIGRELVRIAVEAARRKGSEAVILVGDPPYYQPLGFEKVRHSALEFPGPVDPARVLVVPIAPDVHARLEGVIAWRDDGATSGAGSAARPEAHGAAA